MNSCVRSVPARGASLHVARRSPSASFRGRFDESNVDPHRHSRARVAFTRRPFAGRSNVLLDHVRRHCGTSGARAPSQGLRHGARTLRDAWTNVAWMRRVPGRDGITKDRVRVAKSLPLPHLQLRTRIPGGMASPLQREAHVRHDRPTHTKAHTAPHGTDRLLQRPEVLPLLRGLRALLDERRAQLLHVLWW